ncbi:MAG TPA: alpha/beta hydrolase [Thermoanaerobaculia bacterium]|nr:alpha/beta hydrolase [Thermoanaerobaculia bacterium]
MPKLSGILGKTLAGLAVLTAAVFTAAFIMILWSDPELTAPPNISPEALAEIRLSFEQPYPAAKRPFRMRDGTMLHSQYLAADSKTTIVLVHGVLSSSFPLNRASGLLREAAAAEVVAIDLRGHGASEGRPGDTNYIGQYEDDLADVIQEIRATRPGGKVILAGHSMGGGIALRYALRSGMPPVDGYLLFAPHLGIKSPTTPTEASEDGAQFAQINIPRILGLALMNSVGITAFNGLRTLFFNLPPEMPLRSYSFRAMAGSAPDDHRPALAAVRVPLLVIVGSRDEAFKADQYEAAVRSHSRGTVTIVPDATHNGVLHDPRTLAAVAAWVRGK